MDNELIKQLIQELEKVDTYSQQLVLFLLVLDKESFYMLKSGGKMTKSKFYEMADILIDLNFMELFNSFLKEYYGLIQEDMDTYIAYLKKRDIRIDTDHLD